MTTIVTTKFQQRRKFLLVLPLLVIPFLFLAFYALGGGKGAQGTQQVKKTVMGFNMELPPALFNKNEEKMDKLAFYRQADEDSIRRREEMRQDPYHQQDRKLMLPLPKAPAVDTQTTVLLRRLDVLKRRIGEPEQMRAAVGIDGRKRKKMSREINELNRGQLMKGIDEPEMARDDGGLRPAKDTAAADPELDRLNEMLDKIVRLQKSGLDEKEGTVAQTDRLRSGVKEDQHSQAISMAVPAMVDRGQEVINGATIVLRLTSAVRFNGVTLPEGQLISGVAIMNNDRMQVNIRSIRLGQLILNIDWQVYDLDGLPGIRIPDGLARQAVRQSGDQTIGALNLATYDPTIGGQMTNAGIQAARNFFSRKVRTIRVMVPAGYQVLLRDTKTTGSALQVIPDTVAGTGRDSSGSAPHEITPPSIDSLEPYLHRSVSNGKISLTLKGVYQRDGLLWFYLTVRNRSPFPYTPQYVHLTIRQGRHLKRMAIQEVPIELLYNRSPPVVQSGEELTVLTAIKPFVPEKDKRLVMQMGESPSGTELQLHIKPHYLSGLNIDHEK